MLIRSHRFTLPCWYCAEPRFAGINDLQLLLAPDSDFHDFHPSGKQVIPLLYGF
jgi:hypothetical protein